MGIFGLFGSKKEKEEIVPTPWHLASSVDQIEEMLTKSNEELVVIFKHSTRCPTSRMALRAFESSFDPEMEGVKLYIVDVLGTREVSNEIAQRFQVWHESPQMIILKNGEVVHHSSHHQISASVIDSFM